jgi:Uma2 family endonuclease
MSVQALPITVEDFLKLPEPKEGHLELHHGEVVHIPPPKRGHSRNQRGIQALLLNRAPDAVVEVQMAFRPTAEHEVWVADVGLVRAEREHATRDDEYLMGSPELVVEVISPGNTVDEINEKMAICMDNGCLSFWVVDQKRKRVSVTEGRITKHYTEADTISCSLFSGELRVTDIFG